MNPEALQWVGRINRYLGGALAAGDFDMSEAPGSEAAELVEACATAEKRLAVIKMAAAARVAETEAWRGGVDPDAESWLARTSGTGKRQAKRSLDTAKRLAGQPEVKAAAERGELSAAQLDEVSEAVDANPDAEQQLLDSARTDSFPELKDKANKAKASAGDTRTQHERIRRSRYLRSGTDSEGAFWMTYRNTGDVGAEILAALRPVEDRLFKQARDSGAEREPYEARAADALAEAICGSPGQTKSGPARDIKVIVRVDHAAYRRGKTVAGETCDIVGLGPVPVSTVKEMMHDAFLAAIVTDGEDVTAAVHLGRSPNALQRTALEFTQPDCEVIGCPPTMFLQHDHREGYAKTKDTRLDDQDRLCEEHHHWKTHHGWRLEPGTGKRRFLSPEQQQSEGRGPPAA